jgi:hypothetical protein
MRSVDIANVLRVVDRRNTGFMDDFEHVLGMSSKNRLFELNLLPIFKHYSIQEGVVQASDDGHKFEAKRETCRNRGSGDIPSGNARPFATL